MLGSMIFALASQTAAIEKTVRAERTAYNAAIAQRNIPGIEAALAPGYVVLPGLTGTPLSKDELITLFSDSFRDKGFITYVRHPQRIVTSSSAKRVSESGRWAGTWNKPDGVMTVTGTYLAMWIRQGEGWKLINESFVTLNCTGSAECKTID